jgi:hypothetical protein
MAKNGRSKSRAEARVEKLTWALLVLIFVLPQFLPAGVVLPNFLVPSLCGLVLIGSGFYQFSKHWRVSPFLWIGGVLMVVMAGYSIAMNPNVNLNGFALLITFVVILMGVILDES